MLTRTRKLLHQWQALLTWERRVLVQLAWRLPRVWLQLRYRGFKAACALAVTATPPLDPAALPAGMTVLDYARRCAQLMTIAARHGVYHANCLHQALALNAFLHQTGIRAQLRIGVLAGSRPFQAHAWLELDGVPLGEESLAGYEVFAQLVNDPGALLFSGSRQ